MLKREFLKIKDLKVVKYFFEKTGDILPLHYHTKETHHITVVLNGSIKITGPSFSRILKKEDVCDFDENEQNHQFLSLEDNTIVLNISKYMNYYGETTEEIIKENKNGQ